MDLLEYQGKQLLARHGLKVSSGAAVQSVADAVKAANEVGYPVVVKAQVLIGGRGKAGGVKLAANEAEVAEHAERILGMDIRGHVVRTLWIEHASEIAREYYAAVLLDRSAKRPLVIFSVEGGVEIEEVAAKHPEKILRAVIDPVVGLAGYQARDLAFGLGLSGNAVNSFVKFALGTYKAYEATDASIVEINPLVVTKQGEVIALDAKINLDDNALFRHKELASLRDPDEEDPREAQAKEHDLSYVGLEGNIGCMVNGAGLAMSTMDMIKLAGGQPANFLDVGGGADEEKVTAAFKLLLADPRVKAVLVNIFGGIMKCDVIAAGIIAAAKQVHLQVPLVVRLEGTNVEQGKALLASSGLAITPADDLGDAARKAVAAANRA